MTRPPSGAIDVRPLEEREPESLEHAVWLLWRCQCPLRMLRRSRGVGTVAVSRVAGVAAETVRRWESGDRVPSGPDMYRVAQALGVTCDSLAKHWIEWLEQRPA